MFTLVGKAFTLARKTFGTIYGAIATWLLCVFMSVAFVPGMINSDDTFAALVGIFVLCLLVGVSIAIAVAAVQVLIGRFR